jgi:hypothetical protein
MLTWLRGIARRWLRGWAIVDVGVLGGGLTAAVLYLKYWERHQRTPSAWFDLWPNLATEVIGAWLSVRIIDWLIRRRETRSHQRWRQASILLHLRDLATDIGELAFANEPHNVKRRAKHLDESERHDVQVAHEVARRLLDAATEYEVARAKRAAALPEEYEAASKQLDSMKPHLRALGEDVSAAALKARLNILAEEFDME